jgi:hypothetical protein
MIRMALLAFDGRCGPTEAEDNMKELFADILDTQGVKGVLLLSFQGEILYQESRVDGWPDLAEVDWKNILSTLDGTRETDLVFDQGRVYIRKTALGYLVIPMSDQDSVAMLRLNCDILLPSLKPAKGPRSLKRLFKK